MTAIQAGPACQGPVWSDPIREVAYKARRMWPGPIGETLAQEVLALRELSWLGPDSRPARLCREIEAMDEPGSA